MLPREETQWICEQARAVGFDLCGVVQAKTLAESPDLTEYLKEWLGRGYAGEMKYLRDDRRGDPRLLLEGARSLIAVGMNYNSANGHSTELATDVDAPPRGWISRYAWGDDYHEVLRDKLDTLLAAMRAHFAEPFEAKAYVDTGPVVERVAAKYAGLGWLAKNTCLINEDLGSWLFLGVIVTTLDLAPSIDPREALPPDLCGNCTLCLDACPTQAFPEPYVLDARRCISYLTIELRGAIPGELRSETGRAVFGCDICQDVCPWNRKAPVTKVTEFWPRRAGFNQSSTGEVQNSGSRSTRLDTATAEYPTFAPVLESLAKLSQREFSGAFRGSAVKRAKWRGLVRNACVALGNAQLPRDGPHRARAIVVLENLTASDDPLIAEHAEWALQRMNGKD